MATVSIIILLLSASIHTINCQIETKTATLTPLNTFNQGARVYTNINDVETTPNDLWSVNVWSQKNWQFIIALDSTYGLDPIDPSSISITVKSPAHAGTDELFFGFTTDNEHFVSILVPVNDPMQSNQIYPGCIPSTRSSQSFALGDIASLPSSNRRCDLAHGSCTKWRSMVPSKYYIQMPITFTLEHNPTENILEIYFSDESVTRTVQRCTFSSGYDLAKGLKVYVAGNNIGDSYIIESFTIQSIVKRPTIEPTTAEPTTSTTTTTAKPITSTTSTTSTAPVTTAKPVYTHKPTNKPAITTTKPVTYKPTNKPTTSTIQPTNAPTVSTVMPSKAPSHSPTISTPNPSSQTPTTTPSALPSIAPTPMPTFRPTVEGFVWGAFNQLCPQAVTTTGYCRDRNDIYFGDNIVCFSPYDCCMCSQIECGLRDKPCRQLSVVGAYGVAGVKDITVVGASAGNGAVIDCQGVESCRNTDIIGYHVRKVDCNGDRACYNSSISITDPSAFFALECGGMEACRDLQIEINVNAPEIGCANAGLIGAMKAANKFSIDKITCANNMACGNLQITINNAGCNTVVINTLECAAHDACDGAVFDFVGSVEIEHCKCGPSCMNAVGLEQCYDGLAFLKCTDPKACAQQVSTVTNPKNGFEFICSDVSSCDGASFTIELLHNIPKKTSQLGKFIFGGEYAAMNAVFIIDNQQGIDMTLELVECAGKMACYHTTFILKGNVFIEKFNCARDSCEGCMIKQAQGSAGIPCDPTAVQTFGNYAVNSVV